MDSNSRLLKELKEIASDKRSGVTVELVDGKLTHLTGTLLGPASSPYEGGTFVIDIRLPPEYPFEPPKMRFTTKVWHPNVSSANGAICLDVLKDQWSPALTLKTALLSVQSLLASAEPKDPQDAVVAKQYISEPELFLRTAKAWTAEYATGVDPDKDKVSRLAEMGFSDKDIRKALSEANGDESRALERLCGSA